MKNKRQYKEAINNINLLNKMSIVDLRKNAHYIDNDILNINVGNIFARFEIKQNLRNMSVTIMNSDCYDVYDKENENKLIDMSLSEKEIYERSGNEAMNVNLCEGCIKGLKEYNPYTIPVNINNVEVYECSNN